MTSSLCEGGRTEEREKRDVLVLHNPDPACFLTIAGTQPDIVGVRESDFEAAMRS